MIAVYIDSALVRVKREIQYTFDFIFHTLGYEYKYISQIEQLLDNDILVYYGLIEPNSKEAFILAMHKIMFFIPCELQLLEPGTLEELEDWKKEIKLDKQIPVLCSRDCEIPVVYLRDENLFYGSFKFDLVGNTFFNLINYELFFSKNRERIHSIPDSELIFESTPLIPYVNYYLWLFEQCLKDAVLEKPNFYLFKKELWPLAENGAIALSHNVHRLQKWNAGKIFRSLYKDILLFYDIKYQIKNLISKLKFIATNIEEYWNFDIINRLENNLNFKSTYFFGTESENKEDIDYQIYNNEIYTEISNLLEMGHEIALLASSRSYKNDIYKRQKSQINQFTLKDKIGTRQTGYYFDPKITEELLSKNHFTYDSSKAILSKNGFRSGIGFPYHLYSFAKNKSNGFFGFKNLELPLVFSDDHFILSKTKNVSLNNAKEMIKAILNSTQVTNGLITFNFSVSNFTDVDYDENLYSDLLQQISNQNWFNATYLEIADWWLKREKIEVTEKGNRLHLYFPEAVKSITFSLLGEYGFVDAGKAECVISDSKINFKNVKADTKITIKLQNTENTFKFI
ncbi:MAG: hypothetical protein Q7J16_00020 [Candidatus Cloacimonadales bacterium]|nr:hypothetical protein [Candidatus Cloacimonadales bacterium]